MSNLITIFSNRNQYSQKIKNILIEKLRKRNYEVTYKFNPNSVLNICIGGDGAFLKSVHRSGFSTVPFVGINTGHLGFFQEINVKELDAFLDAYENKQYEKEKIFLLRADIRTKNKNDTLFALNEFLLKGMWSHMIQTDVLLDTVYLEKFAGDGMMISSPVGSTGHNASLGAAILHPSVLAMQLTPIAPISTNTYRSLRNPLIIPKESTLMLQIEPRYSNSSILVVDGVEKRQHNLKEIEFTLSSRYIQRLIFSEDWYWRNLKDKFL